MTDLVLPAAAPVETYIDETLTVLAEILADTPPDVLSGFDFQAQGVWTFARPGAPPLTANQSLDDAGVVDGSLLTLVSVSRTERYRPLVEDVIDAIAVLDESPGFDRAALNRFMGVAIPVGSTAVAVLGLLSWIRSGHGWGWPVALAALGTAVLSYSAFANGRRRDPDVADSLLAAAIAPLAVATALLVPLPAGIDGLGAPNVAAGSVIVALVVLATRGGPRKRVEVASFLAVGATAVTAAAVACGYGWEAWVPAGAIAFGIVTVTNAAKLTVAAARIALPPIPAPGENVTQDELLEPVSTEEASDEESPTWQAIIASVPKSAARLDDRSRLAARLLVGILSAGAAVLATGATTVVVQGHFFVHSLVVAGLVTVVCGFRSRLYAERRCAWALLAATTAVPVGVAARLCLWYPHHAWLVLGGYVASAGIAVIVVRATEGVRRLSPVSKRILELVDGAAVAAVIPLLLWISGVYDMLRNIRL